MCARINLLQMKRATVHVFRLSVHTYSSNAIDLAGSRCHLLAIWTSLGAAVIYVHIYIYIRTYLAGRRCHLLVIDVGDLNFVLEHRWGLRTCVYSVALRMYAEARYQETLPLLRPLPRIHALPMYISIVGIVPRICAFSISMCIVIAPARHALFHVHTHVAS